LNAIQENGNGKQGSQVRHSLNDFRVRSEEFAQSNPEYQNNGTENHTNEDARSTHYEDRKFCYPWMGRS